MDTIISYLNNLFANLPKSERVLALKAQMQASMEDKYLALKAEGRSENEAIGTVIAEFGNIDELMAELGLAAAPETVAQRSLGLQDAKSYLAVARQAATLIGIGVFLCLLGAASLIWIGQLVDNGQLGQQLSESGRGALAMIPFFILIAAGVSLFVFSGMKLDPYKFLETGEFELAPGAKGELERQREAFQPAFGLGIMIGISLCILSPLSLFIFSLLGKERTGFGVPVLLVIVGIAVFFFIYFGTIKDAFNKLLKLEDYANKNKKETDKVIGIVAATVWPLAAAAYLLLGFTRGMWGTAWIIFPVLGLVFGVFAAVYTGIRKG